MSKVTDNRKIDRYQKAKGGAKLSKADKTKIRERGQVPVSAKADGFPFIPGEKKDHSPVAKATAWVDNKRIDREFKKWGGYPPLLNPQQKREHDAEFGAPTVIAPRPVATKNATAARGLVPSRRRRKTLSLGR